MQRPSATFVIALSAVLLGVGFLLGRVSAPPPHPLDAPELASASSTEGRLTRILALPDLRRRGPLLIAFLDELGPEDVSNVAASYDVLRPHVDAVTIVALMDWWARFDPEGALGYGSSFGELSNIATAAAVRRWAQQDAQAAHAALKAHNARQWHPSAMVALARGWAESGAPGVWAYVEGLPRGTLRQQSIGVLVHNMILRDGPEAVQRFAEALPDQGQSRFKLQVFRQVAAALALQHPETAAAWAERHFEGPFGDALLFRVALSWGSLDGEAAASWLAGLPASDAQSDAMRTAYGFWVRRDRERAAAWLEARPPSPALEPAWALLALDVGAEDPQKGLALLSVVQNEQLRQDTTVAVGRMWYRSDREAASAWLSDVALPEELKQQIQAPPPKRRRRTQNANTDR